MINYSHCCQSFILLLLVVDRVVLVMGNNKIDDFEALRNAKIASGLVGGRCIGMTCRDGVLLLSSKKEDNSNDKGVTRQLCPDTHDRIHRIDESIAVAMSGLSVDCNLVCNFLKQAARNHRENFGVSISVNQLVEHISSELHVLTHSGKSFRPLAVSGVLATIDTYAYHPRIDTDKDSSDDNKGSDNDGMMSLVRFDCDGGYGHYHACSTETQDSEEDAVLLSQLQRVSWRDLTVDDAREKIQQLLLSLHVSDSDGNGDGARRVDGVGDQIKDDERDERKKNRWDQEQDKNKDQHNKKNEGNYDDLVTRDTLTGSEREVQKRGNRAHMVTGWAAVMKHGLGGRPLISLSKHTIK